MSYINMYHAIAVDASKVFDKIVFHMLFNELIKKNVCTKVIKLLLYMYTNQDCDVQWDGARSSTICLKYSMV